MNFNVFQHEDFVLYLVKDGSSLCYLGNDKHEMLTMFWDIPEVTHGFTEERAQLEAYFNGQQTPFSLDLNPRGTAFQKSVWAILNTIPFGSRVSYSDVASQLGDVKKVRAVASAIGKNPIMIITPCHRVLGKDGKLHGFRGGLTMKSWLLDHEHQ